MSFLPEFEKVHSRFSLMLEQSFEKWGLTSSQFQVLDTLDKHKNLKIRPKDLAVELDIDMAASTRLIDRLESKKIVQKIRCTDDRRVCFVSLREEFQVEFQKIKAHQKRVEQVFLEGIAQEDRESFKIIITQLAKIKKYRSGETGLSVVF